MSLQVSVVIPNWNRADLLPLAVRSCVAQDFVDDLEIVIVDDGSLDNSLQVARDLRKARYITHRASGPDVQVRVFTTYESLTHNICLPANIGIKRAKYPLVVINPSDTIQADHNNFQKYANAISQGGNHPDLLRFFDNPKQLQEAGIHNWAGPFLRIVPDWGLMRRAQCGGCFLREDLHKITGYDQHMWGWGSNEPDLNNRLYMVKARPVQAAAFAITFNVMLGGPHPSRIGEGPSGSMEKNAGIDRDNWDKGRYAPNEIWGEHPRLEEII